MEIRRTCGRDGCDETFVLRHRNEDRKYCSRACFNKARTDETKRAIFTCEACGRQFEHWASQANRRYCSMDCRLANIGKTAKRYRIGEEQIDSSWEALVIGLLQVLKISYKRDIRDEVVEWSVGCLLYTSDAADDLLCVDLGGRRIIKKKKKKKVARWPCV